MEKQKNADLLWQFVHDSQLLKKAIHCGECPNEHIKVLQTTLSAMVGQDTRDAVLPLLTPVMQLRKAIDASLKDSIIFVPLEDDDLESMLGTKAPLLTILKEWCLTHPEIRGRSSLSLRKYAELVLTNILNKGLPADFDGSKVPDVVWRAWAFGESLFDAIERQQELRARACSSISHYLTGLLAQVDAPKRNT